MAWWTKNAKHLMRDIPESPEVEETEEPAEDVSYDYEAPERGEFDHPHRIRPVEQMLADDLSQPISADAFLAYRELLGRQSRVRAEFDLSIWETVPDDDGSNHLYSDEPEPIATVSPCCGVDAEGNQYWCYEHMPKPVVVAGHITWRQRLLERLAR